MKKPHSFSGDGENRTAAIGRVFDALYQTLGHRSVSQLDDAVLAQAQALGQEADGGRTAFREPGDLQQKLVLARAQIMVLRHLLTELQEAAKLVPELCQGPQQGDLWRKLLFVSVHNYIVSRCNYVDCKAVTPPGGGVNSMRWKPRTCGARFHCCP